MAKIVTVRFDDDLLAQLEELAEKEDMPKGALIKKAVRFYLKTRGRDVDAIQLMDEIRELKRGYLDLRNRLNVLSTRLEQVAKRSRK